MYFAVVLDMVAFVIILLVDKPLVDWVYPFIFYIQVKLLACTIRFICLVANSWLFFFRLHLLYHSISHIAFKQLVLMWVTMIYVRAILSCWYIYSWHMLKVHSASILCTTFVCVKIYLHWHLMHCVLFLFLLH